MKNRIVPILLVVLAILCIAGLYATRPAECVGDVQPAICAD